MSKTENQRRFALKTRVLEGLGQSMADIRAYVEVLDAETRQAFRINSDYASLFEIYDNIIQMSLIDCSTSKRKKTVIEL